MPKPFITKALLRSKIKAKYRGVPRKIRKPYSKLSAQKLLNLAVSIEAVEKGAYRVRKRGAMRSKVGKRNKVKVSVGIDDMMNKASPKRTTTDIEKWLKNSRYWDFAGKDDGIEYTVKGLQSLLEKFNLSTKGDKKTLINRIRRYQLVSGF